MFIRKEIASPRYLKINFMKFTKSKNANVNYLAKIVEITNFIAHPNPEVTRLKMCLVDGYNIIVGIDYEPGKFVYFPSGCTINPLLLSYLNLYRDGLKNANSEEKGMFEDNGRVKSIKLKGTVSEGFLLPLSSLSNWIESEVSLKVNSEDVEVNTEFDTFEHNNKSFWINKKYIVQRNISSGNHQRNRQKKLKYFDKVIDTQFRFHYDTTLIRKDPNAIQPDDIISITSKWHGTSTIHAYVLCKRPKTFIEKLFGWLIPVNDTQYDYLYSSRSVIKNQYYNKTKSSGFYGCDVWGEADKVLKPYLQKGMTIYAEIVGFTPNGGYIQKGYDYGCVPPKEGETYEYDKHFKIRVYRITLTNVDGIVHEFSAREVQQWCNTRGLIPVEEFYYGPARDLYDDILDDGNWNKNFIERLANDTYFYMEKNSPDCTNSVPHEGIVIKKEDMHSAAWKLKSFKFIDKEGKALDAGETNIEDEN